MLDRHLPRLCASCSAPMARQQQECWKCGAQRPPSLDREPFGDGSTPMTIRAVKQQTDERENAQVAAATQHRRLREADAKDRDAARSRRPQRR
jgi:hypothetical protein